METRTITVYEYDELSDAAKQAARDRHAECCGYNWSREAIDSLKSLAEHFRGTLSDWSIDWFDSSPSSVKFSMPDMGTEEIESRLDDLGTYDPNTLMGHGDCKLTGYCADENAIDGFRQAFRAGAASLDDMMQAAYESWLKAAHADCADQYSGERFSECCEANGYRFHANGELA